MSKFNCHRCGVNMKQHIIDNDYVIKRGLIFCSKDCSRVTYVPKDKDKYASKVQGKRIKREVIEND